MNCQTLFSSRQVSWPLLIRAGCYKLESGLLEVAFDANGEHGHILAALDRLLDEPGVNYLLVLVERAIAHIADLQGFYQLVN